MTDTEYRQLIEFLGQQFTRIEGRFEQIDQRFVVVDRRFVQLDERFDALERRVDEGFRDVTGHFEEIYRRLDRLEQEYYAVLQALRRIEHLLGDERSRREVLERSVGQLRHELAMLQARIDDLEQRLRS